MGFSFPMGHPDVGPGFRLEPAHTVASVDTWGRSSRWKICVCLSGLSGLGTRTSISLCYSHSPCGPPGGLLSSSCCGRFCFSRNWASSPCWLSLRTVREAKGAVLRGRVSHTMALLLGPSSPGEAEPGGCISGQGETQARGGSGRQKLCPPWTAEWPQASPALSCSLVSLKPSLGGGGLHMTEGVCTSSSAGSGLARRFLTRMW